MNALRSKLSQGLGVVVGVGTSLVTGYLKHEQTSHEERKWELLYGSRAREYEEAMAYLLAIDGRAQGKQLFETFENSFKSYKTNAEARKTFEEIEQARGCVRQYVNALDKLFGHRLPLVINTPWLHGLVLGVSAPEKHRSATIYYHYSQYIQPLSRIFFGLEYKPVKMIMPKLKSDDISHPTLREIYDERV